MCAKKSSVKKPSGRKAKPKPSRTQLLEEKAQLYDRIRAKERERRKLVVRFDELTKQRKAAKEALGFCETEICGLGHALDEKHPLFDQIEKAIADEGKPTANVGTVAAPADANATAPVANIAADAAPGTNGDGQPLKGAEAMAWRSLEVTEVGATEAQAASLNHKGVCDLGELYDVMQRGKTKWYKGRGVGRETAGKLADGFAAFRNKHPEYQFEPPEKVAAVA